MSPRWHATVVALLLATDFATAFTDCTVDASSPFLEHRFDEQDAAGTSSFLFRKTKAQWWWYSAIVDELGSECIALGTGEMLEVEFVDLARCSSPSRNGQAIQFTIRSLLFTNSSCRMIDAEDAPVVEISQCVEVPIRRDFRVMTAVASSALRFFCGHCKIGQEIKAEVQAVMIKIARYFHDTAVVALHPENEQTFMIPRIDEFAIAPFDNGVVLEDKAMVAFDNNTERWDGVDLTQDRLQISVSVPYNKFFNFVYILRGHFYIPTLGRRNDIPTSLANSTGDSFEVVSEPFSLAHRVRTFWSADFTSEGDDALSVAGFLQQELQLVNAISLGAGEATQANDVEILAVGPSRRSASDRSLVVTVQFVISTPSPQLPSLSHSSLATALRRFGIPAASELKYLRTEWGEQAVVDGNENKEKDDRDNQDDRDYGAEDNISGGKDDSAAEDDDYNAENDISSGKDDSAAEDDDYSAEDDVSGGKDDSAAEDDDYNAEDDVSGGKDDSAAEDDDYSAEDAVSGSKNDESAAEDDAKKGQALDDPRSAALSTNVDKAGSEDAVKRTQGQSDTTPLLMAVAGLSGSLLLVLAAVLSWICRRTTQEPPANSSNNSSNKIEETPSVLHTAVLASAAPANTIEPREPV